MSNPMVRIHNTDTGEIIDREMTDAELVQYEIDQIDEQTRQAKIQAQIAAKEAAQAKLAALGLTVADLEALGL